MNLSYLERCVVKAKLKETLRDGFAVGAYLEIGQDNELQITVCKVSPFSKLAAANEHITELIKQQKNGKL